MNEITSKPAAFLRSVYDLSPDDYAGIMFNRWVAYDPETGVHMSVRRNGYKYVLVWGDGLNSKPWRYEFKAHSLHEAVGLANKRLAKLSPEDITIDAGRATLTGKDAI